MNIRHLTLLVISALLCGSGYSATKDEQSYDPYNGGGGKRSWAELPTHTNDKGCIYLTHFTQVGGRSMRNYTFCFDPTKKASHWVAYPYHRVYDGDIKRRDRFIYDPKISTLLQADLQKSYIGEFDRGHQLPSADRDATQHMNDQTFYSTNMTPQMATLNRHKWATIERAVRNQVCSDTLYIVSGADFTREAGSTTDSNGKVCPLPAAYYKVLLRSRKGDSGKSVKQASPKELQAIGLWVEHVAGAQLQYLSVEEVERRVGFNFFSDIPQEVKSSFDKSLWSL
ncbi:MAG: DNA/RNA non-specific endonuclease [Rikenellaceae bacterium]